MVSFRQGFNLEVGWFASSYQRGFKNTNLQQTMINADWQEEDDGFEVKQDQHPLHKHGPLQKVNWTFKPL